VYKQDKWWNSDEQQASGRSGGGRAAQANDWEEERGKGLSNWRRDEFRDRRGSKPSTSYPKPGRRWDSNGGSRGGRQQQQQPPLRGRSAGGGAGYASRASEVWHSDKWQPAKGRERINEVGECIRTHE